ncbi:MAG: four helix bundle protein [Bacteroidia bacterium]|nr:four helix bundle protein [Bacteroidia bacterium]NND52338.1 four helix bundle protein [Flavobacteriaceae bacterium]
MGILRFEDIMAWQKAQMLSIQVYKNFWKIKDFGYRDQITRASVSVSNNIAEGFDRKSKADFSRFLNYALASNSEVRSMLYLAPKLKYLDENKSKSLIELTNEISKIIHGLKKSLK